jgi:hypothetical protein
MAMAWPSTTVIAVPKPYHETICEHNGLDPEQIIGGLVPPPRWLRVSAAFNCEKKHWNLGGFL